MTSRTEGADLHERKAVLNWIGQLFFGNLWDVYAKHFIEYGPRGGVE